jgi:hypothetical protein
MDFTKPGGNPAETTPRQQHAVVMSMRHAGVLANLSGLQVLANTSDLQGTLFALLFR